MATTWDSANTGSNVSLFTGDTEASGGPGFTRTTTALPVNNFATQVIEVQCDFDPTGPDNDIYFGFVESGANDENNVGQSTDSWGLLFQFNYYDGGADEDHYDVYYRHGGSSSYAGEYVVDIDAQLTTTFFFAAAIGEGIIEARVGTYSSTGITPVEGFSIAAGVDDLLSTDALYAAWGNSSGVGEIHPADFGTFDYASTIWAGAYAWDDVPRIYQHHVHPLTFAPTITAHHVQSSAYGLIGHHVQPINYVPTLFKYHVQPLPFVAELHHVQSLEFGRAALYGHHVQPVEYGDPTVYGHHVQPLTMILDVHHVQPLDDSTERIFKHHVQSAGYGEYVEKHHVQEAGLGAGNAPLFTHHRQPAPLLGEAPTIITGQPTLVLAGKIIEIAVARIHADDGSPFWQADIDLADARDYGRLPRDTAFTLDLYGTEYSLIVDTRQLSRGLNQDGTPGDTASISAISPAAVYASPRALAITQTWETATGAQSAAESVTEAIDWTMVDWVIPGYRLAVQGAAPLDVVSQITTAAGGILLSKPDGSLLARALFPASPSVFASASPAITLTDADIFSVSETIGVDSVINKVRIVDVEASYQDRIEFEQDADNPLRGTVSAYPSPWTTDITLRDTRGTSVRVYPGAVASRQEVETIEIQAGRGSVRFPIQSINSVVYLADDLGGVSFEAGTSELFTASDDWSLMEVTYTTRAIEALAESDITTQAQILLERST